MGPIAAALTTVSLLSLWHLRLRRLPGWATSAAGRTYFLSGYAMVAIAVYWLTTSPTGTTWEWALGNAWALAAMVSFVRGFDELNAAVRRQCSMSEEMETIPATDADIDRDARRLRR